MSRKDFGGEPTRPLVEKLVTTINVGHGSSAEYKLVEDTIGTKWNTPRFRTVTNAWRRLLLSMHRLRSTAQGGKFHFLTADQELVTNGKEFKLRARGMRRLNKRVNNVDPRKLSSDELRAQQILHQRHASALQSAAYAATREISMPKPIEGQASFRKPDEGHAQG